MFKLNCKLSVTAGTDVAVMFQCRVCCIMHARPDASVSAENISATTNGGYYGVVGNHKVTIHPLFKLPTLFSYCFHAS